jgi:hypothetical protein
MNVDKFSSLTFPIHFTTSDSLIGITYAKCGSRYLTSWFKPNGYCSLINVYYDYKINSTIEQIRIHSDETAEELSEEELNIIRININEEYNKFLLGNTKKDILFLYRNPFERIISGIVQEFFSEIRSVEYGDKMKSKLNLIQGGIEFYSKIISNQNIFDSVIQNDEHFTKDEYTILQFLLLEYALEYTDLFLQNTTHTNPQLIPLYIFIENLSKYNNQIKLFDLDNEELDLNVFLSKKFINKDILNSENSRNSNFLFKKMLLENSDFDDSINHKQYLIKTRIENSLRLEMVYYTILRSHKLNVKSTF